MELEKKYEPELELTPKQVADLAACIKHPGFGVIQIIGRSIVDKFVTEWINADDDNSVLRAHKLAKASAQFYQAFVDQINIEIAGYRMVANEDKTPIDSTEVLDMGTSVDYLNNEMDEETLFL